MLQPEIIKAIVLIVLFLLTFLLGIVPIKLIRVARKRSDDSSTQRPLYKRVISFLSCYAAGVFLATVFLDLLPDVRRELTNVLDVANIHTDFPVAEFVMGVGLFAILITEQIVLAFQERRSNARRSDQAPLLGNDGCEEDWQTKSITSEHSISGISNRPHLVNSITSQEIDFKDDDVEELERRESINHQVYEDDQSHSPLRAFLLLLALSLHSVFEGLAVGLQTAAADVLGIFAALVLHKSILSFSLGMNLVQTNLTSKVMIRSILFFSVTAPFGIGIGICIINFWDSNASSFVQGILQGIACGTFLYITFFEVLPHEFNSHHDRIVKLLFLLLGYSTVTGILFLSDSAKKPVCPVIAPTNGTY